MFQMVWQSSSQIPSLIHLQLFDNYPTPPERTQRQVSHAAHLFKDICNNWQRRIKDTAIVNLSSPRSNYLLKITLGSLLSHSW